MNQLYIYEKKFENSFLVGDDIRWKKISALSKENVIRSIAKRKET